MCTLLTGFFFGRLLEKYQRTSPNSQSLFPSSSAEPELSLLESLAAASATAKAALASCEVSLVGKIEGKPFSGMRLQKNLGFNFTIDVN